jgi:hypothetical protein
MISMGRRITQLEPTLHWQAMLLGRDVLEREPVLANIRHSYSNRCDHCQPAHHSRVANRPVFHEKGERKERERISKLVRYQMVVIKIGTELMMLERRIAGFNFPA